MDGEAWWAAVHGVARVGHDWVTSLSLFTFVHWRRKWQPTPVFLPGESQGRGSLVATVYGVAQSRTRLKWLSSSSSSTHTILETATKAIFIFFFLYLCKLHFKGWKKWRVVGVIKIKPPKLESKRQHPQLTRIFKSKTSWQNTFCNNMKETSDCRVTPVIPSLQHLTEVLFLGDEGLEDWLQLLGGLHGGRQEPRLHLLSPALELAFFHLGEQKPLQQSETHPKGTSNKFTTNFWVSVRKMNYLFLCKDIFHFFLSWFAKCISFQRCESFIHSKIYLWNS